MNLSDKLQELKEAVYKAESLKKEISSIEDGFLYKTHECEYGRNHYISHKNYFMALEVAKKYNGDNGSCYIYTTNPRLSQLTHEEVILLSVEDFNTKFPK